MGSLRQMGRGTQILVLAIFCLSASVMYFFIIFHYSAKEEDPDQLVPQQIRALPSSSPRQPNCICQGSGVFVLKDHIPKDQYDDIVKRRAEEYRKHHIRTSSSLNRLIFAPSNSPLQYPIQGFTVVPLRKTLIPGLVLHAAKRQNYKVTLSVSSGVLAIEALGEGDKEGQGEKEITVQSTSLSDLNNLLGQITYTSTVYRMRTGDLAHFTFEHHEAVFPIVIQQTSVPVLYDIGNDINSRVTIVTKTFLRYTELQALISSIRTYYKDIKIIIADDSLEPQKVNGSNIEQYIMPPAQGWFAGRNLAVSQVTTKYFFWVDDDFLFTDKTKIESLVEVMEATPELDVVGGSVAGHGQFYFSLVYEDGNGEDGGCLNRKGAVTYQPVPGFPTCSFTSGVVNLFLGRTDAVRKVGFDPRLKRVAHSEFFMDGLGSLLVASCSHVSIDHQPKIENAKYSSFRNQQSKDMEDKLAHHFFKNHLKCIHYG
ncbi:beta-1,4 N-acetylgalactosaminyltransferase 1-like [Oncorhynchus keta]|uniref:beta-1,4 N-acetylgalactosaminyltransferase 1-like n=1 Tax=Oncorhynchus keta TaxID=8018 RepID=UPI00227D0A22|nr:beta-1,4 N-acetylgalactosaminyltransferase 1-like [Oncorhynchus keta]